MSLEAAIKELSAAVAANTEAVLEHNTRLDALLNSAAKGGAAASDTADEKPKRTSRAKKADASDNDGSDGDDTADEKPKKAAAKSEETLTNDYVKKEIVSKWLGEFASNEDDPETDARKTAIKSALASLVGKDGATVADVPEEDLPRVVAWVNKRKAADIGHGEGRLTEMPGAKKSKSVDDEI